MTPDGREEARFAFGKNWQAFLNTFSEERLLQAQTRLLALLRLDNLHGASFLDVGSGSGLHSLAAHLSGAARVISFDYDRHSVEATQSLRAYAGNPETWVVMQGSVLDDAFMQSLGKADIVYSWGVLHHTGNMRRAIRNAAIPVSDNGVLCLALYSDTNYRDGILFGHPSPEEWLQIKQIYNRSSLIKKRYMEYRYVFDHWVRPALPHPIHTLWACGNLRRTIRSYKSCRGMEFWTDIKDWLGGWPMEFIKEAECIALCRDELGLEPVDLHTGEGNTEYLFRRKGAANYWDAVLAEQAEIALPQPYEHAGGFMWRAHLPKLSHVASSSEDPRKSPASLLENNCLTGCRNSPHEAIRRFGEGRYSHWGEDFFFSTPDNTSPNENGRRYSLRVPGDWTREMQPCAG